MNYYCLSALFCMLLFSAGCKDHSESPVSSDENYDIILVAGQSNTLNGAGIIPAIDSFSDGIFQLGRHNGQNMNILDATEPLDHHDKRPGKIGFALTFAKLYQSKFLANNRKLLIIPCGKGSTGFCDPGWNPGDPLYNDAVNRVNEICKRYPGSQLVAVLWHQGEHDTKNPDYQFELDRMVISMRNEVTNWSNPHIFIAGGMVPFWFHKEKERENCNDIIRNLCKRIPYTGFSDSEYPTVISKNDNFVDDVHFDAEGQREMGRRYFAEYCRLRQ